MEVGPAEGRDVGLAVVGVPVGVIVEGFEVGSTVGVDVGPVDG